MRWRNGWGAMHRAHSIHDGGATHAHEGRRPRRPWLAAVMAGVAVAGYAPALVAVKDPTPRVEIDGVSVLPPAGQTWYVGPRGPRHVVFMRRPPDSPHTVGAVALVDTIEMGGPVLGPIRTTQDLNAVTERRLQSGGRFTTIDARVRPDTTLGAECVRVDAVQEERDNPRAPGVVRVLVTHSLDGLHPRSPGDVVSVSDSERDPKGQHAVPRETLRAEGEPFIRSATFTPVR